MIEKIYNDTLQKLSNNTRVQIMLTELDLKQIVEEFQQKLNLLTNIEEKKEMLKKYLFILSHSTHTSKITHQSLISVYKTIRELKIDNDFIIFYLSAIQKQFIDHQSKSGDKIPAEIFHQLKEMLSEKNTEVLEWTLRTIESLGPQSLFFKDEILKLKPSLLKLFNEHQTNAFMIVDLIKKNWEKLRNERR